MRRHKKTSSPHRKMFAAFVAGAFLASAGVTAAALAPALDALGISLIYKTEAGAVRAGHEATIAYIMTGVSLSQLFAFAVFLFGGRNILARPYQKLEESQRRLARAKHELEKLAQIPLNNPHPLIHFSPDGALLFANPAARRQYPDIADHPLNTPLTAGIDAAAIRNVIDTGNSDVREVQAGEYCYQRTLSPSFMGAQPSAIAYFSDVTDRKRFEAELIASKDKAEESNTAKSEFLANMSHELRTPMNGILGMTELLLDAGKSGEEKEMLQTVHNAGENLLALLNDILDISKVEAGDLTIEHVPFDLDIAVSELFQLYQPIATDKKLEMRLTKNSEDLPSVIMGDLARFQQILRNLISNALKFTEKGGITLSLYSERDFDDNRELYFSVRDTGIGIPEHKLGAIFDKFTQADSSTSRKFGGTGLGLAITKQLVGLMGGRIGVESTVGEGTIFYCAFPIILPAEGAKPVNVVSEHAIAETAKGFDRDAAVLAVDDHPVNIMFIRKLLTKMGFTHIDTAESGKEALHKIMHKQYDIVFMDCQMPEMDGYQTTRAVRRREHEGESRQLIVAMTANAMLGDKEKCLKAGMDDYISKPVKADKLTELLERRLPSARPNANDNRKEKPAAPAAVIDPEHFAIMFDDASPEETRHILGVFIDQCLADLRSLSDSIENNDCEQWRKAAHRLKGSAANLGAGQLAETCRLAEENAYASQEKKAAALTRATEQFADIRAYLMQKAVSCG